MSRRGEWLKSKNTNEMVYVKARSCFICCIIKIEVMSNLVPGCCTLPQVFTCGTGNRTLRHGFCEGWLWSFQRVNFTGYTPKPGGCNGKKYGKPFDLGVSYLQPHMNVNLESLMVGGWPPRVFDSDDKQKERQYPPTKRSVWSIWVGGEVNFRRVPAVDLRSTW